MALISFPPLASAECGFEGEFYGKIMRDISQRIYFAAFVAYAYGIRADDIWD